jgi:type III restriction enzyme
MFKLKTYQKHTLDALAEYLENARVKGAQGAFEEYVSLNPTDVLPQRYVPFKDLEEVPHVCLRLPTGGGKTVLAAKSVGIAADKYMERDYPLVLWLVPSNTIRTQTADALKKPDHPCREALNDAFGGNVDVYDITEVNRIRSQDLADRACVVIATYQTLRVADANKEKRKVYGNNENFEPHFKGLPNIAPGLDRDENGQVLYSFANLLHQLRPLVIADEAHQAVSELSDEMMLRINPSCILEYTATPVESNILYRVFASELKAEEMVKLPFALTEHGNWEQAVSGTVQTLAMLEEKAKLDTLGYIRPIALLQAQSSNKPVTVEVLKKHLIENENVAEDEIAIATGEQRELDDIDLFDKTTKIRFIITIKALKEGWDCSFAYVLCSVDNISSATEVEQLLGRVMRMPYATRRPVQELNKAYAHVVASKTSRFSVAAEQMHEKLTEMGFGYEEAAESIEVTLPGVDTSNLPMFREPAPLEVVSQKAPKLDGLDAEEVKRVTITKTDDGEVKVSIKGSVSPELEERLVAAVPTKEKDAIKRKVAIHRVKTRTASKQSASQKGDVLKFPRLCVEVQGSLEFAEPETILRASGWNPLDSGEVLTEEEFKYDETAKTFIFDLKDERLEYRPDTAQEQYSLLVSATEWADTSLARWLTDRIKDEDTMYADLLEFNRRSVEALVNRGIELPVLGRAKYVLGKALEEKLKRLKLKAREKGFQQLLMAPDAKVELSLPHAFTFKEGMYPETFPAYNGHAVFEKHFFPVIRDMKHKGEEFQCAQIIERHPKVKTWVRNLSNQIETSFWLPLSSGRRFYPDFVGMLDDGRMFVIEYKGKPYKTNDDSKEKNCVGELWERKSDGKCLYLMAVEVDDDGRNAEQQIKDKFV